MQKIINFLFSKHLGLFFLLIILSIIFYRSPYILLNGRFVAEEGSLMFRNSYLLGPWFGLTQVYWGGASYLNLWSNIASVFATFVKIEYAPYVTVYFALSVKIYLFVFILFSYSNYIRSNLDKIAISFLVLLSPPMVPNIWLNTLTSQVYFGILTILVLFQNDDKKNFFYYFSPVIILISGLSSILICTLIPFFFYNFIKNKNKFNFFNLLFLGIGFIVQFFIFFYSHLYNLVLSGGNERFFLSSEKFINFVYNVFVKSFFGRDFTQILYYNFFQDFGLIIIAFIFFIVIFFLFIIFSNLIIKDHICLKLFLILILISSISFFGSKMNQVQGRYAVLPGILLLFNIYRFFQISLGFKKFFCLILIVISISTGAYQFKMNSSFPEFLVCETNRWSCPHWSSEIEKWKNDKKYLIRIWNFPGKTMKLY